MVTHAPNHSGDDRTLCGDAMDAFESEDSDEPIVVAQAGELVTCVDCRIIIDHVRQTFLPSYRVRKL